MKKIFLSLVAQSNAAGNFAVKMSNVVGKCMECDVTIM